MFFEKLTDTFANSETPEMVSLLTGFVNKT